MILAIEAPKKDTATVHGLDVIYICHGPLARYVKLRVAHAPGMPGTFSPPPRISNPDMHHGTCVTHVPWCMPGSLTSGFRWNRWRGKRSRHSRCMRNPQFYVSSKRSIKLDGSQSKQNGEIRFSEYKNICPETHVSRCRQQGGNGSCDGLVPFGNKLFLKPALIKITDNWRHYIVTGCYQIWHVFDLDFFIVSRSRSLYDLKYEILHYFF